MFSPCGLVSWCLLYFPRINTFCLCNIKGKEKHAVPALHVCTSLCCLPTPWTRAHSSPRARVRRPQVQGSPASAQAKSKPFPALCVLDTWGRGKAPRPRRGGKTSPQRLPGLPCRFPGKGGVQQLEAPGSEHPSLCHPGTLMPALPRPQLPGPHAGPAHRPPGASF